MTSHFLSELISFLDGLPEPRIVMSADYRVIAANTAYTREFGGRGEIAGRHCYEVSHHFDVPCDQAGESCPLKQSLETGAPQRVLHLHHTPRGEEHVAVETTPIRDEEGQIAYFVETMRIVRQASSRPAAQGLVGRSPAFVGMLEKILRVANADAAVLLLGETGTGKELVAHAIHEASAREEGPFVAVDCAGMTETLFESELFGSAIAFMRMNTTSTLPISTISASMPAVSWCRACPRFIRSTTSNGKITAAARSFARPRIRGCLDSCSVGQSCRTGPAKVAGPSNCRQPADELRRRLAADRGIAPRVVVPKRQQRLAAR